MEASDSSFRTEILSKKSNIFPKILNLSKINAQGNTIIMTNAQKIKFFIEGNVKVNLYPLLSSASDVNLPFLSLFIYIIKSLIKVTEIFFYIKIMGEEPKKSSGKGLLVTINAILFLINVWKFINNPGSEVPILGILFNMIIYIAIIILIIHKKEITFEDYIQKQIEKYGNKK